MFDCNPVETPVETGLVLTNDEAIDKSVEPVDKTLYRQMVGSLRYICNTRPDLAYGVGLVSRYMENPGHTHLLAVKRLLRYLKGTLDFGIMFPAEHDNLRQELMGFSDSDWCGDKSDRKSTTGYIFKFGEAPVSWCSKKQQVVALSSCEAEYIAACMGSCQALWLQTLLEDLKIIGSGPVTLIVDNKSAINLAKNPVAHGRSKHIETRFHFLRDQVSKNKLRLQFCRTDEQVADVLTKALKKQAFLKLRKSLGVRSLNQID